MRIFVQAWSVLKIETMLPCLDGVKHLFASVANCCDTDLAKQPRGLQNPEALARETVCMSCKFVASLLIMACLGKQ